MLIEIKRNSHNNQLVVIKQDNTYHKVALTPEGNNAVVIEKQGYDWFGIETSMQTEDRLYGLIIPEFRGKTFPFYNGISGNEDWIYKLIEFYKIKWHESKFAIHGDLALCNIIFGDKIYIVDWEHFHYASSEYYGFDIFNMLFIHLQYEYRWWSYWGFNWVAFIRQSHKDFIRSCHKLLGDIGFTHRPFTNSAQYIIKYMDKDKFILGKQSQEILESLDIICQ